MKTNAVNKSAARRLALALIICALAAGQAAADPVVEESARRGLVLGLNAGFGGSGVNYRDDHKSIEEDAIGGALGAFRVGYSFSQALALTVEGHGFGGTSESDEGWGVGAGVLALTWHPGGSGFFVRGGFGGGGGEIIRPDTEEKVTLRDRAAWLFGVGYDWWLNDKVSLGLAADGFSLDVGGKTGFDSDTVGTGGLTVQINWYL